MDQTLKYDYQKEKNKKKIYIEREKQGKIIWIIICTRTRVEETVARRYKYIYSRHVYFIAKIVSSAYKRGREGGRFGLEFNGCRVARNLENINAFPWPYTSLILGLLYPTGVIVMEVFQLRTNLIFQAGADGAL